jgi:cytochrome c551/c552
MKTVVISFVVFGTVLLVGTGCYYDVDEELNPESSAVELCDTASLNYAAIKTVFENGTCLGCHQGATANAGLDLSTYAGISQYLENPSNQLIDRITVGTTGDIMPPSGPKLSDCNVSKVSAWLNNNFPE